jgi:hypothetical protein
MPMGNGGFQCRQPARLIVDRGLNVLDAEVNVDYTIRPEPTETIKKLEAIKRNQMDSSRFKGSRKNNFAF